MNGRSHQSNCDLVRYLDRPIGARIPRLWELTFITALANARPLLPRYGITELEIMSACGPRGGGPAAARPRCPGAAG